jgi:hypothetical protein
MHIHLAIVIFWHCVLSRFSHWSHPINHIIDRLTFEFSTNVYIRGLFLEIFNTASVTLPLADAHELNIVGGGPSWPAVSFDSLPNIHTIRFMIHGSPFRIIGAALADNEHSHQLRSLCSLQFSYMSFLDEDIRDLMDGLKCRILSGFPIEYIRLDECFRLKQADVMRMEEFVQDVEWDGVVF